MLLDLGELSQEIDHGGRQNGVTGALGFYSLAELCGLNFGIVTWQAPNAEAANMAGESAMWKIGAEWR